MNNTRSSRTLIGVMLILFILIASGYLVVTAIKAGSFSKVPGTTWVEIDPTQCRSNPWEVDWQKSHDSYYDRAFRDYSWANPGTIEKIETEIIIRYYEKQGIQVAEVKSVTFDEEKARDFASQCLACECLAGYTLYLLIPDFEVDKMVALGYKVHE